MCNPENQESCKTGLRCSSILYRCVKKDTNDAGVFSEGREACKSYSECMAGEYCGENGHNRVCKNRLNAGSTCKESDYKYFGEECDDGLICINNLCTQKCRKGFSDCPNDQECVSSAKVDNSSHIGLCKAKPKATSNTLSEIISTEQTTSSEGSPKKADKQNEEKPVEKPSETSAAPGKPVSSETSKTVKKKPKKAGKSSSQEAEEEEEEEDSSVPVVTPGETGKEALNAQNPLLKLLGLSDTSARQLAFYAVSACAMMLLLVILIVWIVACVRRGRKKRADKKKDLEVSAAVGPETALPSYDELEQHGNLSPFPAAMEKGAGEKKGQ